MLRLGVRACVVATTARTSVKRMFLSFGCVLIIDGSGVSDAARPQGCDLGQTCSVQLF